MSYHNMFESILCFKIYTNVQHTNIFSALLTLQNAHKNKYTDIPLILYFQKKIYL